VKLLRRGADEPESGAQVEQIDEDVAVGKGRPTPKRRDVAPKRQPVTAPRTRKEASARLRQQRRSPARGGNGARMSPQEQREALRRGDPAALPKRDRGPVRKLARDYVDSRRLASNYLLLLFIPMLVAPLAGNQKIAYIADVVVIVLLMVLIVEWYATGRRVLALAHSRGLESRERPMGVGFYCGTRAWMPRRWRLPSPMYQIGDEV